LHYLFFFYKPSLGSLGSLGSQGSLGSLGTGAKNLNKNYLN
jgi:hypothetical protein